MPVPDQQGTIDRRLLRDTAYEALCRAIITGMFAVSYTHLTLPTT